jgi:prevent-host-death family protein
MKSVSIREAKTNLSRLVAEAAKGEAFMIAKAGKPLIKVVPLDAPAPNKTRRLGFMSGRIKVPDDFDRLAEKEIAWARVKETTSHGAHILADRERLARS